ncbi:DUF1479-domain-containing protein [Dacryopinax primogenitus]|uniref:DUF1479-domain-containing protein n=1 Tax=Dacryopinax primogenitus (strain DJM 731) TaxID=1858805 RepID=M5GGF8_DACPD|nr:DUF1479-domain-containing protein [Dacryopinax primogenitus]EJU05413.1 DUF1479-domain-containing protein [Dacryopinax primogenitus]
MTPTFAKPEGDISSVFASLSDRVQELPQRFATLKEQILGANAQQRGKLEASWQRLVTSLETELNEIVRRGSEVIPVLDFSDISSASDSTREEIRKRGACVIKNVVPKEQALEWKDRLRSYIKANPSTKAFPPKDPQVYELYWSTSQMEARAHPNLLLAQQFLMSLWDDDTDRSNPAEAISFDHSATYCDRLRIRQPGDKTFSLGPHVDGGGVERWEDREYRNLYAPIWNGEWEKYNPYSVRGRLRANMDLYNGPGACSMFRMFQGWLSMSAVGAHEGTLLVMPLIRQATAYWLLRPFFGPPGHTTAAAGADLSADYLRSFRLLPKQTSILHGATPGMAQELSALLHPHLRLSKAMTHMPRVQPGDYVAWHCDTVHAVDPEHQGKTDSSVLYIPTTPLCLKNVEYLAGQRETLLSGTPPPDFPGGMGECLHVGRGTIEDAERVGGIEAVRAMGLAPLDLTEARNPRTKALFAAANQILDF